MGIQKSRVSSQLETAIEDFEIILEVLAGNRDAYGEIVRRYQERIRGYCRMLLSNEAQAEDAAQEVFIKAYQSLAKFRGNSSFSTWLYRINANHCTDLLRKSARQKTESWDALLEKKGEKAEALFSASSEDRSLEQSELLTKILSYLPEKARTILLLREIQGLSYQEIADTLECSIDAVKGQLKRARQEIEIKTRHLLKSQNV